MSEGKAKPGILYLNEAAALSRVPIGTLHQWRAEGRLRTTKPGRRVLVTRRALAEALGVDVEDLD